MHPCASWLTLALLTGSHAAPPPAAASATPPASPAPARAADQPDTAKADPASARDADDALAEKAAALYSQRKYLEAAEILEGLWARVQEPRDLFNAALARIALGHRAHAIAYWDTYLKQPGIPGDGREQAETRRKKAEAASVAVLLRVGPSAVAEMGVNYTFERVGADPRDTRPPLHVHLEPDAPEFRSGGRTVYLDAGKWRLKVEARGYLVGNQEIVIKAGQPGFPRDIVLGVDPMFRQATFQIEPPAAVTAGASVTLKRMTLAAQPVVCELSDVGTCTVKLEPGDWEVTVQAPGFQRYSEKVSLGASPTARFAVALTPTVTGNAAVNAPPGPPVPPPTATPAPQPPTTDTVPPAPAAPAVPERVPRHVRVKLSTGLIASGIPLFIGGLALGVVGSNNYQDRVTAGAPTSELLGPIRSRAAGIALVGAAVGLWTTGLTAEYDVKPRAWYAELGVGAGAVLAGTIWTAVGTSRWNQNKVSDFHCGNSDGVDCFAAHRMAAGFFLGAGASLVVGSTIGLLVQRKHMNKQPRTGMSPFFGNGSAGLLLQGRF
ncbi:MAG: hypothetical protein JNL82_15455 [Myxococcales bacterium]|nr:hypothetical protein [Myxococcales bacterium]